ncbi:hypothetical protein AVEN_48035-1 [Araneus ventricosus]|uniref:Uncharacterized protein n=1 Tax=Araneus ventricosus TaxID=182803 RepID=A0A4Y2LZK3_ARAVE|nr:hypothetical protein AVEN_48035-1 [Araneus ventricosus]
MCMVVIFQIELLEPLDSRKVVALSEWCSEEPPLRDPRRKASDWLYTIIPPFAELTTSVRGFENSATFVRRMSGFEPLSGIRESDLPGNCCLYSVLSLF